MKLCEQGGGGQAGNGDKDNQNTLYESLEELVKILF